MNRSAFATAFVLLAFLAGCGKDNPVKPQITQPKYAPSSTPQNTLHNLQIAYTTRDSSGYDSLFDAAYLGASFDPITHAILTFSKTDESLHIRALARTTSITNISLNFPPVLPRYTDASDPPGWATVSVIGPTLEIDDSPTSIALPQGETMQYKFRPTSPSPGSPTDTTWHIIGWTELP